MCKICCCCSCCEEQDEKKIRMVFTKDEDRSCINFDLVFLIGFICFWIGMISATSAATVDGDPNKLIYPVDYEGAICGVSEFYLNRDWGAWPYPLEYEIKVCLSGCDQTESDANIPESYRHTSEEFIFYCVPDTFINGADAGTAVSLGGDSFNSLQVNASRAIGDLYTCWIIVLCAPAVAWILSFVFIKLMKHCAGCLVWGIIFLFLGAGFIGTFTLLKMGYEARDTVTDDRSGPLLALGFAVGSVVFVLSCVIFCYRKAIMVAIDVVEAACGALDEMKSLSFFPFFPMFLGFGYFLYWIVMSFYIFSNSNPENVDTPQALIDTGTPWASRVTYVDYVWDDAWQNVFLAHFFHLLWNVQFLVYFAYMVTAGAVAQWYFAENQVDGDGYCKQRGDEEGKLPNSPVYASCFRTVRYHLGAVAFGSLLIAIVQFIRAMVMYIESKVATKEPNCLQKAIFKILHCCLYFVECCIDKISKNAFIWVAIWGDDFITGACQSVKLLLKNLARIAAINTVGTFVLILGKLLVSFLTAGIAGMVAYYAYNNEISSVAMPCFVCFVFAFLIATLVLNVLETTIDTVFLCFLVDEQNCKENHVPMRGPKPLQDLVEAHKTASQAIATHKAEVAAAIANARGQGQGAAPAEVEMKANPAVPADGAAPNQA